MAARAGSGEDTACSGFIIQIVEHHQPATARDDKVEFNDGLLVWAKGWRDVAGRLLAVEEILTLLAEAPPRIAALTAGLSPAQLRARPTPDEWSANDVLAHLRSCADMWGNCMATIVTEGRPTIRAVNPGTWIKQTDYPDLEFRPSLRAFAAQRADLLAVLEPLPPEGWSRAAWLADPDGNPIEIVAEHESA